MYGVFSTREKKTKKWEVTSYESRVKTVVNIKGGHDVIFSSLFELKGVTWKIHKLDSEFR